jgi:hypothetical protein
MRDARAIPPNLWAGVLTDSSAQHAQRGARGDRGISLPLQQREAAKGDEPVATFLLVWLFQPCPPCPPFRGGLIRMPGWRRWIRRCICVMSDGMVASMSIWQPTTSVRRLAKRAVLLQVRAKTRQFAVWHEDQIVKLLPIKGLIGQEMALDNSLHSIQQEALAAPRRSPARSGRKVRQLSLWSEGA